MTSDHYYITTTIPYVNGSPHIGHALEFVQADALARRLKLLGHRVTLQTGTDDNAIKNVQSASEAGIPPEEFVDQNAYQFLELCHTLCIDYDQFVRTSSPEHALGVQKLWSQLQPEDLIRRQYSGLYCYGCEDFYRDEDLVDGLCPDHQRRLVRIEEENYFFRLSRYQKKLEQLIESDTLHIEPRTRKSEVLSFIRQGLTDISVSRHKDRSKGWGIPVPDSDDQIIYVWIDALVNYLSGLGFGSDDHWKKIWNTDTFKIHCVGKNVWKFHAIYWPALLLSAGLPLPNRIYVHGFLAEEGKRISKTLGFKYDPLITAKKYGAEALRFYLLKEFSAFSDGNFTASGLIRTNNSFLANGIGNLVSRIGKLREKAKLETLPARGKSSPLPHPIFRFDQQIEAIWKRINQINAEINEYKPWKALDTEPEETRSRLTKWTSELLEISWLSKPYLPGIDARTVKLLDDPCENQIHLFERI